LDDASTRTPQLLGSDVDGRSLAYSPDGRWLVIAGEQNRVWVRDERGGEMTELTVPGDSAGEWLQTAVFRPDGALLAVAGSGGVVHFLHVTDGKSVQPLPPKQWVWQSAGGISMGPVYTLAMSPDGRFLAAAGANKYLYILDTVHGRLVNQPFPLDAPGLSLQFGATWQYLALAMSNGRVSLLWLYY
jgi:WD40 repeat protein